MNGLVATVTLAVPVGDTADDTAEQVALDDDAVERDGVLDYDHSGAVDELLPDLEVGEPLLKRLVHDIAPEAARGQHIGLV